MGEECTIPGNKYSLKAVLPKLIEKEHKYPNQTLARSTRCQEKLLESTIHIPFPKLEPNAPPTFKAQEGREETYRIAINCVLKIYVGEPNARDNIGLLRETNPTISVARDIIKEQIPTSPKVQSNNLNFASLIGGPHS